jgi:acyl carrier protein
MTEEMKTSSDVCAELERIWSDMLRLPSVRVDEDFYMLGGDSMLLVSMLIRVSTAFDRDIDYAAFMAVPTIQTLARLIEAAVRSFPMGDGAGSPFRP